MRKCEGVFVDDLMNPDQIIIDEKGHKITSFTHDLRAGYLYRCNPSRNKECRKTECYQIGGECFLTSNPNYAWYDDEFGSPMVFKKEDEK